MPTKKYYNAGRSAQFLDHLVNSQAASTQARHNRSCRIRSQACGQRLITNAPVVSEVCIAGALLVLMPVVVVVGVPVDRVLLRHNRAQLLPQLLSLLHGVLLLTTNQPTKAELAVTPHSPHGAQGNVRVPTRDRHDEQGDADETSLVRYD